MLIVSSGMQRTKCEPLSAIQQPLRTHENWNGFIDSNSNGNDGLLCVSPLAYAATTISEDSCSSSRGSKLFIDDCSK